MTELAELEAADSRHPRQPASSKTMQYARAFAGLFLRDLHVLRRESFPLSSASA